MPRTVCIILGHPDGTGTHFCHALADAYARGAAAQGVTVERLDIAEIAPEPLHDEGEYESAPAEGSAMAAARAAVMRADHLVIVFPLWLGGMPARLKAFMEQLARDGFLIAERAGGGWPEAKLKGRTARVIVTMGMPAFVYRTWFLNAGVAVLKRLILGFAGVGPVRQTTIGGVGGLSEVARARRLDRVDALGRRLI